MDCDVGLRDVIRPKEKEESNHVTGEVQDKVGGREGEQHLGNADLGAVSLILGSGRILRDRPFPLLPQRRHDGHHDGCQHEQDGHRGNQQCKHRVYVGENVVKHSVLGFRPTRGRVVGVVGVAGDVDDEGRDAVETERPDSQRHGHQPRPSLGAHDLDSGRMTECDVVLHCYTHHVPDGQETADVGQVHKELTHPLHVVDRVFQHL